MMEEDYKKEVVLMTSKDIVDFMMDIHGVDVDIFEICELVNFHVGNYIVENCPIGEEGIYE